MNGVIIKQGTLEIIKGVVISKQVQADEVLTLFIDEQYPGVPFTKCVYLGNLALMFYHVLHVKDYVEASGRWKGGYMRLTKDIRLPRLTDKELDTRINDAQQYLPVKVVFRSGGSGTVITDSTSAKLFDVKPFKTDTGLSKASMKRLRL